MSYKVFELMLERDAALKAELDFFLNDVDYEFIQELINTPKEFVGIYLTGLTILILNRLLMEIGNLKGGPKKNPSFTILSTTNTQELMLVCTLCPKNYNFIPKIETILNYKRQLFISINHIIFLQTNSITFCEIRHTRTAQFP